MTDNEQLQLMRLMVLGDEEDDSKDTLFSALISNAQAIQLNVLYPFDENAEVDDSNFRLRNWQVRCAVELYNSFSHQGIQSYSENGYSITYLTTQISNDLLHELVPKAGVPNDRAS